MVFQVIPPPKLYATREIQCDMTTLSSDHLKRYRDISWLLWRHGRADWVRSAGLDKEVEENFEDEASGPESLAQDLESLGPAFIKVGQLLSSRADLLPPAYLTALARLRDDVKPVPFDEIEKVIVDELDARPSRIFGHIDETPLATASLAQVHAATLRDGRPVVVKVQRPGIGEQIRVDFEVFAAIAKLSSHTAIGQQYGLESLVEEFRQTILQELDYREEVQNLVTIQRNLAEFPLIRVPTPYSQFSSRRVLTMDRCTGVSVASISPVVFTEVDGMALADELFAAYLKQILVDGFFHADPHSGNVLLERDHRLALIDLGMVGRLNEDLRQQLLNLVMAVSEGRAKEAAEVSEQIGRRSKDFDREDFTHDVSELVLRNQQKTVGEMEVGRMVLEIQRIAGDHGLTLPSNLALVGKTLMNLDDVGRRIAPDFDPNASIRRHSADLVRRRMRERVSLGNLFHSTMEMTDIAAKLPKRVNDLLTQIGDRGIQLDVDAVDEVRLIRGVHKIANRITSGLIIAALIVGAALIMKVDSKYTLLGYPTLAIVLFLSAAIGGIVLLVQIFLHDRKDERG